MTKHGTSEEYHTINKDLQRIKEEVSKILKNYKLEANLKERR